MRKFLLFALLTCFSVAANAETKDCIFNLDTYPWNYEYSVSGRVEINFTSHWAEYVICASEVDVNEYTGYEFTFSEVNGSINVVTATADGSYAYNGVVEGTVSKTFDADKGNVTKIELQFGDADDAGSCIIEEACLVKADGTKELVAVYGGAAWGCTGTVLSIIPITYTNGPWGGVYLLDAETLEPITFTYGNGDKLVVTITLDEGAPVGFMVEPDGADGALTWINLEAGETEYVVTINDEVVSADVEYIYIKSNIDDESVYPYTLAFSSVTATYTSNEGGDTGEDSDELPIDNDWDLSSGWSSSYDGATHTITYDSAWAGRGWWFGDPDTKDCSEYDGVEVVLKTDMTASISLTVQYAYYADGSEDPLTTTGSITGSGTGEEQTLYCDLDPDMADKVIQIWIQSSEAGQVELVSAKFVKNSGGDEEPDGWNPPADEDNLWIEWVERYDFISDNLGQITEWWADENWNVIYDGHSEYWTHGVMDREWNITVPDGIGSQEWQGQFIIWTSIPAYADHCYNFGCKMKVDGGDSPKVCVKLTEPDRSGGTNDTNIIYDNSGDREYVADGETWYCCGNNLALSDKEDTAEGNGLKLVFDFPGTPGGTVITVTDIYLLDLTATGIEEVVPAEPVAKKGIYNLAGQRVNANAKGLLIIDGKKVLVK